MRSWSWAGRAAPPQECSANLGAVSPKRGESSAARAVKLNWRSLSEVPMTGSDPQPVSKLDKPKSEWRQLLPPDQFAVLFEEGTERPFSHPLNDEKRMGIFQKR